MEDRCYSMHDAPIMKRIPSPFLLLVPALLSFACGGGGGGGGAANRVPVAVLTLDANRGAAPLTVVADSAGSYDPDGALDTIRFDFGDGTQVEAASAGHTYAGAGTFTIELTVTDDAGATATASRTVTVDPPSPPPTPGRDGLEPGADDYLHADVSASVHGAGATEYRLFEPAAPTPDSAPVVVFLHGYTIVDPAYYQGFIEHVVRRGNIVVFPRYQAQPLSVDTGNFTGNAITAIGDALVELQTGGHVAPELDRLSVLGHSFGGVIAANVAALAAKSSLPTFRAVVAMAPGTGGAPVHADYSKIPAGTLLLAIACDADVVVGDTDAKRIFSEATAVDLADRDYILVRSDTHGIPPLVADHSAPSAISLAAADALDRKGFWKWFDALQSAALYGTWREHALGDTPEQRDMGTWPDATPIREPVVTDTP